MAALIAIFEILLATGVPTELRRIAAEIEAELAAEGDTPTGSVWDQFQWGFDIPTKTPGDYRATDDDGGGGLLAIGGIAGALLLFKLVF
jgi:hypothetical protein